jgi:hypothetical protein
MGVLIGEYDLLSIGTRIMNYCYGGSGDEYTYNKNGYD